VRVSLTVEYSGRNSNLVCVVRLRSGSFSTLSQTNAMVWMSTSMWVPSISLPWCSDPPRFDYIQRDAHMIGEAFSFAARRVLKSARVINDQICYNIKDANQIYRICQQRFELHKHCYNHKTGWLLALANVSQTNKLDSARHRVHDRRCPQAC